MEDWGRRCENLGGRQTAVQRRESRPSKPLPHHQRIANTARTFSWYIQTSAAAVTHFYKITRNVQPECSIIGFYHTYLLYIQKLYPVHVSNFCAIKAWYKYTPNRYENWIVCICLFFLWSSTSLSLTIKLNNFFYLVTVCKE